MSNLGAIAILREARKLLSEPGSWIQYEDARDASGTPVPARNEDAKCFCLVGALERASYDLRGKVKALDICDARAAVCIAVNLPLKQTLIEWNDTQNRTADDVLNALTTALQIAESS